MKVCLEIKNLSKLKSPKKNDIMIYDGKEWYITTKDELFKDINTLVKKCEEKLEEIQKENENFKKKTSNDILELTATVRSLLEFKGE